MEKLESELRKDVALLTEEKAGTYRIINVEDENDFWIAIVVEDYQCQELLKWELQNIIDKAGYEAVVKVGDYVEFSGEDYEDLDTSVLDWQVVYVMSNDFWKMKQNYNC